MPETGMAPHISVFRATEPRKVKRNRQALSCSSCQKRKSRCDRRQPCSSCEKRGDAEGCKFGTLPVTGGGTGVTTGSRSEVQSRLTKLEELVRGLADQPMPGRIGPWPREQNGNSSNPASQTGQAKQDETTPYNGPTSWSALVDSIRDIQSVLEEEDELDTPEESSVASAPDVVFGDLPAITIDEVLKALPPRADVNKLITVYFGSKFIAVPVIHTQHFKRRYDRFWDDPNGTNFLWISIMFSMLSCAAMMVRFKGIIMSSPDALADPKTYSHLAVRCLLSGKYLQAKQYSVEAVVMLAHSCNVQKQDSDAAIWTLYALAIRLAQRQGYHRHETKLPCRISPFEAEMRRRVWFVLESYDLLFSYQQGMPPMTHEDASDVGAPMNMADEDFDEDSLQLIARPPVDPLPILAWVKKAELLPMFRRMLRHALGVRRETPQQAKDLGVELDKWHATIPVCLRYRPIRESSFTDPNYTIFHRIMLEIMYHMGRCLLYRSFMLGGGQTEICLISLELCRDSALKMLDIHFEVDREITPGGRLYEDRFMVSSLTLHGFLIAAMIICLEVNDCKHMRPEDRRNRIDVLHAAHQMWIARSSTSSDARHACRVLKAILNRIDSPQTTWSSSSASQTQVPSTPEMTGPNLPDMKDHEQVMAGLDLPMDDAGGYAVNFDELLPLDGFFSEQEGLDWNSIDRYLRLEQVDAMGTDRIFPESVM